MAFTYTLAKVPTEALHWVRFKVGATKADAAPAVQDEEVNGALAIHGLTATTAPSETTKSALCKAAASLCRSIAAGFARQGGQAVPVGQSAKNTSAETFLKLAEQLEAEAMGLVSVGGQLVDTSIVPHEEVDSVDYRRGAFGQDHSEYVGDEVS